MLRNLNITYLNYNIKDKSMFKMSLVWKLQIMIFTSLAKLSEEIFEMKSNIENQKHALKHFGMYQNQNKTKYYFETQSSW